jgi:hypothetical protein
LCESCLSDLQSTSCPLSPCLSLNKGGETAAIAAASLAHLRSVVSFEAIGAFLRASGLLLAVDCSHGLAAADMRAQKSSENALKIQETARSYLEAVLLALGYESEELEAMLLRRDSRVDAGSEARVSSAVSVLFNLDKQNSSALLDDCPDLGFILSPDGSSCRVSG